MPVNEQIVTGKKYRVLKDKANALWNRISFWTSANDVEFTDSGSLQGMRLNEVVTTLANGSGVPGDTVVAFDSNEIIPEGWESTTKPEDISNLETAVSTLNANLDGFKFYPTGTNLVALISDDSFYTDSDGNYVVWGTATAEQLVEDNPNTYKSVASEEDTRGKEGADTAIPFKGKSKGIIISGYYSTYYNFIQYMVTTYEDGIVSYVTDRAFAPDQGMETDYFKIQGENNSTQFKLILKKGKWITQGDNVIDATNSPIEKTVHVSSSSYYSTSYTLIEA